MSYILIQMSTSIKKECTQPLEKGELLPKRTGSQKETTPEPGGNTPLMQTNITESKNRQVLLHPWSTELSSD